VNSGAAAEIKEARMADLPVLLRMMRNLAEQPPALPFDDGEVRAALEKFIGHAELGQAWLLWADAKPVGYVILTMGYSFEFRGRDAFIDELYIEPELRRKGLGRRAMKFVEERAREFGVNAVHLEVDRGNVAAQELYRRAGYVDPGRLLMTKWLRAGK
jgi:ribosomal protein S18 acetylase RimI-like enzyme